jgi:hypothetical protein
MMTEIKYPSQKSQTVSVKYITYSPHVLLVWNNMMPGMCKRVNKVPAVTPHWFLHIIQWSPYVVPNKLYMRSEVFTVV